MASADHIVPPGRGLGSRSASTELVLAETSPVPIEHSEEFFVEILAAIPTASPESLREICAWADAAATAARIRREEDRADAACRTRLLAERRLGELLRGDPHIAVQLSIGTKYADTLRGLAGRFLLIYGDDVRMAAVAAEAVSS